MDPVSQDRLIPPPTRHGDQGLRRLDEDEDGDEDENENENGDENEDGDEDEDEDEEGWGDQRS